MTLNYLSHFGLQVPLGSNSKFTVRILITGGNGFIGGRLGKRLSENGFEVVLGSRKRLNPPIWLSSAHTVITVWESESELAKICSDVDVVIHAAGMNAQNCLVDPSAALNFNGLATARLVNAASKSKVRLFIYLSTAHVYMKPLSGFIDEKTPTINTHPYATSHLVGEKAVLDNKNSTSFQSLVLRVSNAVGYPTHPEVNCWDLLVNNLCRQVVSSRTMNLDSTGSQLRNFVTISDVCEIIYQIILLSKHNNLPEIINIGAKKSNSTYAMAELVQKRSTEILGFTPPITTKNKRNGSEIQDLDFESAYLPLFEKYLKNNYEHEIDILLAQCKLWFADKKM